MRKFFRRLVRAVRILKEIEDLLMDCKDFVRVHKRILVEAQLFNGKAESLSKRAHALLAKIDEVI